MRANFDRNDWQGLGEKRALSISVILKKYHPFSSIFIHSRFKLPISKLIELIDNVDGDALSADQLGNLLLNFPKDDELLFYKRLPSSGGLEEADSFCFEVSRRPVFRAKIEILVLQSTLPMDLSNFERILGLILDASEALLENNSLIKTLLFKTLQCGNFLNQVFLFVC